MQVLMVGALPKWRGDGHLSSVESQLPYVFVNLDARRRALRGTQQQVRAGSAIRNHLCPHRAADDCRPHRIPTGRFPSPVTTHPDPCAPPRNVTVGTVPSGGRRAARTATTRWPKIAHQGPPRTPSAHRPERATGRRPRTSPIDTGLLRAVPQRTSEAAEFTWKNPDAVSSRSGAGVLVRVHGWALLGHPRRLVHDMGNETVTA